MNAETTTPLVSICIPTYNAEGTIRETLASVVKQNYSRLNILIVDNASTDRTLEIVAEFADNRIKIHRNDINIGGERNFNRCIELATGKYVAIFHADDIYERDMVERQVLFLEANPEAGAVFTEASLIDETGSRVGAIKRPEELNSPDHLYKFRELFKAVLHRSNFLICPSVMARTGVYQEEIKGWRGELFGHSSDLDVWLRLAQRGPIGILPMPLMRYRISTGQFTAQVRLQTTRADFFRVTDFYLSIDEVKSLLEKKDLRNLARLERRDRVMRAVNSFLVGDVMDVGPLLYDIHTWDTIKSALESNRGFAVLVVGCYLRLLLLLRLNEFGRVTLSGMKRLLRK